MAQRFGGQYSPQNVGQPGAPKDPLPDARAITRTKWLTWAAVPFLPLAFSQASTGMVADLAAFGIYAFGMELTREGLKAEAAFNARKVARAPGFPRKLFGGVMTGVALALGSLSFGVPDPGASLIGAGLVGAAATALHLFSFGLDPMRSKGTAGIDTYQQDRVARAVDEGEAYLAAMKDAILRTKDRRLAERVEQFSRTARGLFRRVEDDPRDLTAARRYLGVYLMGARDATVKFVDLYAQTRNPDDRAAYLALLEDLSTNFANQTRALIETGRSDMEIEMSVLRERLAREGVRAPQEPRQIGQQSAQTMDALLARPETAPLSHDEPRLRQFDK